MSQHNLLCLNLLILWYPAVLYGSSYPGRSNKSLKSYRTVGFMQPNRPRCPYCPILPAAPITPLGPISSAGPVSPRGPVFQSHCPIGPSISCLSYRSSIASWTHLPYWSCITMHSSSPNVPAGPCLTTGSRFNWTSGFRRHCCLAGPHSDPALPTQKSDTDLKIIAVVDNYRRVAMSLARSL